MNNVTLQLDFEVPEDLVGIYMRSSEDDFIGYETPLSMEEARSCLERYSRTKVYGKRERIAIMKIFLDDVLVGYSLPRIVFDSERKAMGIEDDKDWYRLGTIFIDKPYRGKGLITTVVKLFREQYPNVCWQCEEDNKASFNSAIKAGLVFVHDLYFNDEGDKWSFEQFDEFVHCYRVLRTA